MPEADDIVLVVTTTDDRALADAIARALVERRLAACVRIVPVGSVYRWDGEICAADEFAIEAKTTHAAAGVVQSAIAALHSYDLPEILVLPALGGSDAYLGWIRSEVTPPAA
ncbi:divalent-cation tolerance protein CutA [Methylopila henanensis]|uniref:Divalent-cation tolerance protein CutA n=1 Tax=Methylopila henanensis TaxID=873516 RepID=A0ABW4K1Y8_9HYPH